MNDWINTKHELPELSELKYSCYAVSASVLVYDGNKQRVAKLTFDRDENVYSWRTECSECWELPHVTHWKYLSKNPE